MVIFMQDDERRLLVLKTIQDVGGFLVPSWAPCTQHGYLYNTSDPISDEATISADLEWLASLDYLAKRFHNRLTRCPKCRSHHLNVREVCPSCGSANLKSEPLLHHFRCGYVAPVSEFPVDPRGGRICPKCEGRLRDLGTDHDMPGDLFRCLACGASTPSPDVAGVCLACSESSLASDFYQEDIYVYAITNLGRTALRDGRLFESGKESLFADPVNHLYRAHIIRELLDDDRRRWRRYGIPVSALLAMDAEPNKLIKSLRDVDKIGQWNDQYTIIHLPATKSDEAAIVQKRLEERGIGTLYVDVMNDYDLDHCVRLALTASRRDHV